MDDDKTTTQVSGDGRSRRYLQENDRCFNISRVIGNGIHLKSRTLLAGIRGDDYYFRTGLLLGPRIPLRNIPILKWIV